MGLGRLGMVGWFVVGEHEGEDVRSGNYGNHGADRLTAGVFRTVYITLLGDERGVFAPVL